MRFRRARPTVAQWLAPQLQRLRVIPGDTLALTLPPNMDAASAEVLEELRNSLQAVVPAGVGVIVMTSKCRLDVVLAGSNWHTTRAPGD